MITGKVFETLKQQFLNEWTPTLPSGDILL